MKAVKPVHKGKDYTGEKIGKWLVTGEAYYKQTETGGRYLWKCRCECGTEKTVNTTSLLYGRSTMCLPCSNSEKETSKENNHNWKGYGSVSGTVLQKIKWNARRRSRTLPIDIDAVYLDELWEFQKGKCAYTGRSLEIGVTASVDRIDSNLGYVKGNVQWLHKDVNKAKMALTDYEFVALCVEVANFKK